MLSPLTILYRGPLSSCNYACAYCPFAKRRENRGQLEYDRACLERLLNWVEEQRPERLRLFFTPWGEALVRRYYREALVRLACLDGVEKLVVQTNLSAPLGFAPECRGKLALWATFHPDWSERRRFLHQCRKLEGWGVPHSVGVVGFARFREQIAALRAELPASTYLWINAVKQELPELDPADRAFFSSIDPHFELNTRAYPSLGRRCRAGETVISVDGEGTMRTCHFQPQAIGNLYRSDWRESLQPRRCGQQTCRCHIGYVHLDYLELERVFGSGILERIPARWPAAVAVPGRESGHLQDKSHVGVAAVAAVASDQAGSRA